MFYSLPVFFQFKSKGTFRHWNDILKPQDLHGVNPRELLVQTMDTARYCYIMELCINMSM
jgi:hypothetical protein